jgi:hypothetical protein
MPLALASKGLFLFRPLTTEKILCHRVTENSEATNNRKQTRVKHRTVKQTEPVNCYN